MKSLKNPFAKILTVGLLAASLFAPSMAEELYTVNFQNGIMQIRSAPDQNGNFQVYSVPSQFVRLETGQIPMRESDTGFTGNQASTTCPLSPTSVGDSQTVGHTSQQAAPARGAEIQAVYAEEVLRLTNESRAKHGLAPLAAHSSLDKAAAGHSVEMLTLGYFSHTSPTPGRQQPWDRVAQAGANPMMVSENIFQASGHNPQNVAQLAVDSWLQSPGHRRNMLDPNATHIGIGFVVKDNTVAVTQVFSGRN